MKVGDLVKFVGSKVYGLVVGTGDAPDLIRVRWWRSRRVSTVRISGLEVVSESR
jgi:hypothetical protein